jgi:hypothetical protein
MFMWNSCVSSMHLESSLSDLFLCNLLVQSQIIPLSNFGLFEAITIAFRGCFEELTSSMVAMRGGRQSAV